MLKVTCGTAILFVVIGCTKNNADPGIDIYEQNLQKVTEARIDSAFTAIRQRCDSILLYQVPLKADSIFQSIRHE